MIRARLTLAGNGALARRAGLCPIRNRSAYSTEGNKAHVKDFMLKSAHFRAKFNMKLYFMLNFARKRADFNDQCEAARSNAILTDPCSLTTKPMAQTREN